LRQGSKAAGRDAERGPVAITSSIGFSFCGMTHLPVAPGAEFIASAGEFNIRLRSPGSSGMGQRRAWLSSSVMLYELSQAIA
jgi:hypothetical protein